MQQQSIYIQKQSNRDNQDFQNELQERAFAHSDKSQSLIEYAKRIVVDVFVSNSLRSDTAQNAAFWFVSSPCGINFDRCRINVLCEGLLH